MFDKGDLVRWYPDYDNDIDYELAYFDSYAREDPRSCYIYEVNNTLTGWYTDIDRIKESNQADYDLFLMNIYSNRDEENPLKKS
jgi:hypothetical protein